LKRSNRLILLIGVFLAIVTFVGIVLILQRPTQPGDGGGQPTTQPTVFATREIPLGVEVTADMLRLDTEWPIAQRDPTAYTDPSLVVGKIARQNIGEGAQVTPAFFTSSGQLTTIDCPDGQRCIALQVDQVSGVGTLIRTGDYIDLLVAFTGDKFPIIQLDPENDSFTVVAGVNPTSAKLLLQGLQVVGTLLPPAPAPAEGGDGGEPGDQPTALTGQQEIVILSVDAQQAEVIKFAQLDGSISMVLRSPADFVDPDTREPIVPPPAETTGITLRVIVDEYDVLVPQLVEAILPNQETP
jgi:pilus assembly protein CpaB